MTLPTLAFASDPWATVLAVTDDEVVDGAVGTGADTVRPGMLLKFYRRIEVTDRRSVERIEVRDGYGATGPDVARHGVERAAGPAHGDARVAAAVHDRVRWLGGTTLAATVGSELRRDGSS